MRAAGAAGAKLPVSVTAPAYSDDDTAQAASTSVAAEQTARETAAQTVAQNAEQADRAERADQVVEQQASVKEAVEQAVSAAGDAQEAAAAESAAAETAAKEPEAQESPEQAQRARRAAIAAVLFSDKGVSEPKPVQQTQPAMQKAKAETADKAAANKAAESKAAEGKTSEGKAATETAASAVPAVTAETAETAETAHNNQTRAQRTRRRLAITPTFSEPEPEQEEPHRRLTRAMSALLFQEPVLPATNASAPSAEPSPAFDEEEEAGHRRPLSLPLFSPLELFGTRSRRRSRQH